MEEHGERKRFDVPKPVSAGDTVKVHIDAEGGKGDGIAKVEGFVVFVKGAKTGEDCMVKIVDVKRTYAVGEKTGGAVPEEESPAEEEAPDEESMEEETPEEEEPAEEKEE